MPGAEGADAGAGRKPKKGGQSQGGADDGSVKQKPAQGGGKEKKGAFHDYPAIKDPPLLHHHVIFTPENGVL